MILFLLSFLAGILTVLAPCTISLLPVIVGGSLDGKQSLKRAIVVTSSLGLSVILFTLILKVSTAFINIPQEFWQVLSGGIIFLIGVTMIYPSLYENLPWINKLNQDSNKILATGYNKQNFWGDVIIGAALGPVFSSCSPTYFLILATVLPHNFAAGIIYLLAYAVGLSGALLVVCFAGQKLLQKLGAASDPKGWIKRTIGILFLIIGIAIFFGYDKKIETNITGAGFFDVTKIEQKFLAKGISDNGNASQKTPEITDPSGFINTGGMPIKISDYIGKKVILVDFWTYSCINCQRTLPYMKAWYDKYFADGLEIISIHTPEFAFEKVQANVQKAVDGFGIQYPVVMDNDFGTWNAFGNHYWPHKYLIDIHGNIIYDHTGEGDYDVTEVAIQNALAERASVLRENINISGGTVAPTDMVNVDQNQIGSPETYFGSNRNVYLANGITGASGIQDLSTPENMKLNSLYLGGTWNFNPEFAEATAGDTITYKYKSKNVYFVASSASGTKIKIMIDGKPAGVMAGSDVSTDGTLIIKDNRLYHIVSGSDYSQHTITIEVIDPGLDAYTFTFG